MCIPNEAHLHSRWACAFSVRINHNGMHIFTGNGDVTHREYTFSSEMGMYLTGNAHPHRKCISSPGCTHVIQCTLEDGLKGRQSLQSLPFQDCGWMKHIFRVYQVYIYQVTHKSHVPSLPKTEIKPIKHTHNHISCEKRLFLKGSLPTMFDFVPTLCSYWPIVRSIRENIRTKVLKYGPNEVRLVRKAEVRILSRMDRTTWSIRALLYSHSQRPKTEAFSKFSTELICVFLECSCWKRIFFQFPYLI